LSTVPHDPRTIDRNADHTELRIPPAALSPARPAVAVGDECSSWLVFAGEARGFFPAEEGEAGGSVRSESTVSPVPLLNFSRELHDAVV
jgi:hypothetical protein